MHQAPPSHAARCRRPARCFRSAPLALSVLGVALAGPSAKAQSSDPAAPPDESRDPSPGQAWTSGPTTPDASYGADIVLADVSVIALGTALFAATKSSDHSAILLIDALAWSLTSPLVHAAHGRPGWGAASLLLHVGLPLAGAFVGAKSVDCPVIRADSDPDPLCGAVNVVVGAGLGLISATILDAAILAQTHDDTSGAVAARGAAAASAPMVSVARNGDLTFGWRGTF
jgi:hypothetical protein